MKNKVFISILWIFAFMMVVFAPATAYADEGQPPETVWTQQLGTNGLVQTGSVKTGGFIRGWDEVNGKDAEFIIKTDSHGDFLWKKYTAYPPNYITHDADGILEMSDGGYITILYSPESDPTNIIPALLVKMDSNFHIQWSRKLVDYKEFDIHSWFLTGAQGDYKLSLGNNDSFYIANAYYDGYSGRYPMGIIKIDSDGNLLWAKVFEDCGRRVFSMFTDKEGNIITLGFWNDTNHKFNEGILMKISSKGEMIWEKSVTDSTRMVRTLDGFCTTASNIGILTKIDSQGNIEWKKTAGTSIEGRIEQPRGLALMPDGGFLLVGITETEENFNNQKSKAFVIRTDSQGNKIWEKIFGNPGKTTEIGPSFIYHGQFIDSNGIIVNPDGSILLEIGIGIPWKSTDSGSLIKLAPDIIKSEPPIQVKYNGNLLSFDSPPVIQDGRLQVPIRPIAEAMGATLEWDQSTQTAVLTLGIKEVRIIIDQKTAYVDGEPVTLDVPAQIIDGRTMVPLRFISQGLGAEVSWDEDTRTASIIYTPTTEPSIKVSVNNNKPIIKDQNNNLVPVVFKASASAGVESISYYVVKDGKESLKDTIDKLNGSLKPWNILNTIPGNYKIIVRLKDKNHKSAEDYEDVVVKAAEGPKLSISDPAENDPGVAIDKIITITFSKPIQFNLSSPGTLDLIDAAGNSVPCRSTINGDVLTIDPKQNLAFSTKYKVIIPAGLIMDSSENQAPAVNLTFTTCQPIAVQGTVKDLVKLPIPNIKVELVQARSDGTFYVSNHTYTDKDGKYQFDRSAISQKEGTITVRASLVYSCDGTESGERFAIHYDDPANKTHNYDDKSALPIHVDTYAELDITQPVVCDIQIDDTNNNHGGVDALNALVDAYNCFLQPGLSQKVRTIVEINDNNFDVSGWNSDDKIIRVNAKNIGNIKLTAAHEYGHEIDYYQGWKLPYNPDNKQWIGENWANFVAIESQKMWTYQNVNNLDESVIISKSMKNLIDLPVNITYLAKALKSAEVKWGWVNIHNYYYEMNVLYDECCKNFPGTITDDQIKSKFTGLSWHYSNNTSTTFIISNNCPPGYHPVDVGDDIKIWSSEGGGW